MTLLRVGLGRSACTLRVRSGYALIAVVGIIIALLTTVTSVLLIVSSASQFEVTMSERTQIRAFARAGLEIAQALMGDRPPQNMINESEPLQVGLQSYANFLVYGNTIQEIVCTPEQDGFDGTLRLYITCQQGKLPLRAFIVQGAEENTYRITDQGRQIWNLIQDRLAGSLGTGLLSTLEEQLKTAPCDTVFDDMESLLVGTGFSSRVVYPRITRVQGPVPEPSLLDLASDVRTCSLFLLSPSVLRLVGITPRILTDDERQTMVNALAELAKSKNLSLAQVWNTLYKPLYNVAFDDVPAVLQSIFTLSVPRLSFTVLVHAQSQEKSALLWAEFEKTATFDKSNREYVITKLRWLS